MSVKPSTAKIVREEAEKAVRDMPSRRWYPESDREERVWHVRAVALRQTMGRLPDSEFPGVRTESVRWVPGEPLKAYAQAVAEELVPQNVPAIP